MSGTKKAGKNEILLGSPRWKTIFALLMVAVYCTSLAAPVAGQPSSSSYKNCIDRPIVSGSLSLNFCTQKTHYNFGETVSLVGILANNGPAPITYILTSSAVVQDKSGHLVLREVTIGACFIIQTCTINPGQSITIVSGNWQTNSPFFQAIVSGPYTALLSLSTCPPGSPSTAICLEANLLPLRITVSVPQS